MVSLYPLSKGVGAHNRFYLAGGGFIMRVEWRKNSESFFYDVDGKGVVIGFPNAQHAAHQLGMLPVCFDQKGGISINLGLFDKPFLIVEHIKVKRAKCFKS